MALNGSWQTRVGGMNIYVRVEWSAAKSTPNRYSVITANLYLVSTGGTIQTGNNRTVLLSIAGYKKTGSANFTLSNGQKKHLLTHQQTLYHNANGDLNAAITGMVGFAGLLGQGEVYAGGTASVDTMGPANTPSTISLDKTRWKVHTPLNYTISRKNSSHTHRIELMLNGTILKTINNPPLTGGLPQFTATEYKRMYEIFNGRVGPGTLTLTVRLYTLNGSTQVGLETAVVDVLGTYSSRVDPVANIDARDIDRRLSFSHDNDVPKNNSDYMVIAHLMQEGYSGYLGSVWTFQGLDPSITYNIASGYDNSDFNYPIILDRVGKGKFYWRTVTTYQGVELNMAKESDRFDISLNGAPGIELHYGFLRFVDTEDLMPHPTLVRGLSKPLFFFDWNKASGSASSMKLTVGNTTVNISPSAESYSWGSYMGGTSATVSVTNEYGIEETQTVMIAERGIPSVSAQVRAVRQGFTTSVRVTFAGTVDNLNGKNNITKTELRMGSGSWVTVPFSQSGNSFNSSSFRTYTVPIDSSGSFSLRVTTPFYTRTFTGSVSPAKPLFYIGEQEKNIGLGKYPRAGNMVDSEYPIYAPVYNFSDGASLTSVNNSLRIHSVLDYVDIWPSSSYVQFSTNKGTYYFDKQLVAEGGFRVSTGSTSLTNTTASSLVVTGNTALNNVNKLHLTAEPTTNSIETGRVGIGGWGNGKTATSGSLVGYTVNFRTRKTYTPSSIQLTEGSASLTKTPQAIDIDQDGFWFYFGGDGVESYRYWRGYYRA